MGIFSRLEAVLERIFEAPAGRLGASLQPISLAKRIERAMDTGKQFGEDGVMVPNQFDLHLNPSDYASFESYLGSLEDDLAHGALSRARREHYQLVARPRVQILPDPSVARGDVKVAANMVDDAVTDEPQPRSEAVLATETLVLARPGHEVAAPESARRAHLLVRTGGSPAVQFDLGAALITIGRASDNDVILDDPEVSRHHCQLKLQHGAYSLADLGSRNGSWVNGDQVTEMALGPGDRIQIGSTEIEFMVHG